MPHHSSPRLVALACLSLTLILATLPTGPAIADEKEMPPTTYTTHRDIAYRTGDDLDEYAQQRCKLDLYAPDNKTGFATVVWFHAGGMTQGKRFLPFSLKNKDIAIVAADYRLHPRVNAPAYIEDAAAAIAWTLDNIERFGGDPDQVFVTGASAGGYLAMMTTLDKRWLGAHGHDANRVAGIVSFSGQCITHFTVRKELGVPGLQPFINELAPLTHVRGDAPPLLLITGDRHLELPGRYEENAYLYRMMKAHGHADTTLYELDGFDHGGMTPPSYPLLLRFVRERSAPPAAKPES